MFKDGLGIKKAYIACGYTDLRYGVDGLASLVQYQFDLNPFDEGTIFLFCGRKNDRIKALVWEGDGFLLLYKRVAEGRFNWPRKSSELKDLTPEQLARLLDGFTIDPGIKQIPAPEYAL
jgi:transposase